MHALRRAAPETAAIEPPLLLAAVPCPRPRRERAGFEPDFLNGPRGAARGRVGLGELTRKEQHEQVLVTLSLLEMTRIEVRDYPLRMEQR